MQKRRQSFQKYSKNRNPLEELDNERYLSLVEDGFSDSEIAREFDIDYSYFRRMKEDWGEEF